MTNLASTEHKQGDDQEEHGGKPGQGGNHPFKVTVRTLAGHSRKGTVKPSDTVVELTDDAVKHFVAKGQLTDGAYALTLPRTDGDAELDPTATPLRGASLRVGLERRGDKLRPGQAGAAEVALQCGGGIAWSPAVGSTR
jgi:hypothetical protein